MVRELLDEYVINLWTIVLICGDTYKALQLTIDMRAA